MIQIYDPENTNWEQNGDMVLLPTSAVVYAVLNGAWELKLSHTIDKAGRWKYIKEQAVIKLPSFNGEQLFRVVRKNKNERKVEITAEPIFMDARGDCWLTDIRPTLKNGQEALDLMLASNAKYSGTSNITRLSTAYYQSKNLIEALNGDQDNSFVNRWGGEILFDNFGVVINDRIGGDYGVSLLYGKNIKQEGISELIDYRDVVTRIYPKAYNGYSMSNDGFVDSPIIGNYITPMCGTITFDDVKMQEDAREDDEENGVIICANQEELDIALTKRCEEQYAAGIDKPAVQISVDIILLQNTREYQGYEILETVSLGDTVHLRHSRLGIQSDARIIELEYDAVRQKVSSVVIGDFTYNYFNNVSSSVSKIDGAIRSDGTVMAEMVQGFLDGTLAQMRVQNSVAKRSSVRAILFEDLDPESEMFGALAVGTQGLQISVTRTADGRGWDWTTALTAKGMIADIIVAGTMLADRIRGGTLSLGGSNNNSGVLQILNAAGVQIGKWDKDGIQATTGTFSGTLSGATGSFSGDVTATSGHFSSVTINGCTLQTNNMTGSLSGGTYSSGTISGGRLSNNTSGTYVGTCSGSTLSSCTTGGTTLSVVGGSLTSYGGGTCLYGESSSRLRTGSGSLYVTGNNIVLDCSTTCYGSFSCTGTKSRTIQTQHFGNRQLDALEMPVPMFSDCGVSVLDENGYSYIVIDPIFAETVNPYYMPTVFLTKYGQGDIWVDEERTTHEMIVVCGTPGLRFSWETRYQQGDCCQDRLRVEGYDHPAINDSDFALEADIDLEHNSINYENEANEYLYLLTLQSVNYADEGFNYFENYERGLVS